MGLLSQGNVHAAQEHLNALLEFCRREGLKDVPVHCFLDGRDAIFNSALGFVGELEAKMAELGVGKIATMAGRFYAMDRDNRWDRIEKAYNAIVKAEGEHAETASGALEASYEKRCLMKNLFQR